MSKMESEWIGGAQLAAMLGITTMTLWRWERDAKLGFPRPTVIRDRKYWSRADINEWMRAQAVGKASRAERVA